NFPSLVKQFPKRVQVPPQREDVAQLARDLAHLAKGSRMLIDIGSLPRQHLPRRTRLARVENDKAAVQLPLGPCRADHRIDAHMSVRLKADHLQASVSSNILILLTNGLLEFFDF